MTAFNIIKSLTKQGNAVIGAGCYAAALSSRVDGNKVIKIGNNMDDPWLDYYMIIKANQHNPCVPRIYSFYMDRDSRYYVCVMERLQDCGDNATTIRNADLCKEYTQHWITREEFIEEASKQPRTFPYPEHLADILDKISDQTDVMGIKVYDCGDDADMGGMRRLDMHSGNFLYRDGAIVVTDPWCEADISDITNVSDWWASRQVAY
ncbi:hypothetical protein EBZ57_02885 [bacterium]|nr:hypothetical protein [bacterium]